MSLAIPVDKVTSVLLANGWNPIKPGTFGLDAYEFVEEGEDRQSERRALRETVLKGGSDPRVPSTGFRFDLRDESVTVYGPISAILAVRRAK